MTEEQDNSRLLDSVVRSLSTYKSNASSGKSGWLAAAIAMVITVITVAILAFQAFRAGKARAKALHEAAVKEEMAKQAEVDSHLTDLQQDAEEKRARAAELLAEAQTSLDQERRVVLEQNELLKKIDQIMSWDDVDNLLHPPAD